MKYFISVAAVALLLCLPSKVFSTGFELGYTYRQDCLHWSIGFESPNILSELIWDDLRINQVTATGSFEVSNVYFRGCGSYGRIFHGVNRDSDYLEDDRQGEFSRALADAGRGEVFDLSAGVGYQLSLWCDTLKLIPLLGGSWREQHLQLYNGKRVIPVKANISGLHSSYKTRWYTFWTGIDVIADFWCHWSVFGTFEYHLLEYRGRGHWNLRTDFQSDFKHYSNGYGLVGQGGVSYYFTGNSALTLVGGCQEWRAGSGLHKVRFSDGMEARTGLNEVHWHSWNVSLLWTYLF